MKTETEITKKRKIIKSRIIDKLYEKLHTEKLKKEAEIEGYAKATAFARTLIIEILDNEMENSK